MPNYKFEVRLENMELSKSQEKQINDAIGAVIGKTLIGAGISKQPLGEKLKLNKEWKGKWLRKFATPEALKESVTFKGIKQL